MFEQKLATILHLISPKCIYFLILNHSPKPLNTGGCKHRLLFCWLRTREETCRLECRWEWEKQTGRGNNEWNSLFQAVFFFLVIKSDGTVWNPAMNSPRNSLPNRKLRPHEELILSWYFFFFYLPKLSRFPTKISRLMQVWIFLC